MEGGLVLAPVSLRCERNLSPNQKGTACSLYENRITLSGGLVIRLMSPVCISFAVNVSSSLRDSLDYSKDCLPQWLSPLLFVQFSFGQ